MKSRPLQSKGREKKTSWTNSVGHGSDLDQVGRNSDKWGGCDRKADNI